MRGAPRSCDHGVTDRRVPGRPDRVPAWCAHDEVARRRHAGAARGWSWTVGGVPSAGHPSTLLVYVMDVYDPRAYAYQSSVSAVLTAACPLVEVEVVQSGRYASRQAAAGVIALLATEQLPVATVLETVQHEFFVNGRSLNSPAVLHEVALRLGLDAPAVELFGTSERARELAASDAELAGDLDGSGGPLLLASRGERIYEFDGLGATGERLVDQFKSVLARP